MQRACIRVYVFFKTHQNFIQYLQGNLSRTAVSCLMWCVCAYVYAAFWPSLA